ncbi:MAG: hypothetical protein QOC92_2012 [Acidimicrobiaceae bacterium]
MRRVAGVLFAVGAVVLALVFLIVFITKAQSGGLVAYYAMAVQAAAAFGCAVGARWAFRTPE